MKASYLAFITFITLLTGCNKGNNDLSKKRESPAQVNDTTSINYTTVRRNCPEGNYSPAWLVSKLRAGENLDILVGCETKISFEQKRITADGDIVIMIDANTQKPLVIVEGSEITRDQISGRIYINEPAIYSGLQNYTLPDGTIITVARFQLLASIKHPRYIGLEDLKIESYVGKNPEALLKTAYIERKMKETIASSGGLHSLHNKYMWYEKFMERISECKPCKRSESFLVCEGNAPHGVGTDEAILGIDTLSGDVAAAMTIDGKEAKWYGCDRRFPTSIRTWLITRGAEIN